MTEPFEQPTKRAISVSKWVKAHWSKRDANLITDIQAHLKSSTGDVTDLLTRALVELKR